MGNEGRIIVEPLHENHDVHKFDCGSDYLNSYLQKHALANHKGRSSRTHVAIRDEKLIGYYSIAPSSISPDQATRRLMKGQGRYPVPVFLIARLAVDVSEQGRGYGKALLKEALLRCYSGSDTLGGRAVIVHAKDEAAYAFYSRFGFEESPMDKYCLMLLMKDIAASLV